MKSIFLSYRTVDSVHATAAISEELDGHFGRVCVFRDHDSLTPGALYPGRIRQALAACDTMLAVIGPHWLTARYPDGTRCIDDLKDWVRLELVTAFRRRIPVVPLLLDQTPLPARHELPNDVAALAVSNFWQIRHQTLPADVRGLIQQLDPGATARPDRGATYTQQNTATENGAVYAVQGGDQHINGRHR